MIECMEMSRDLHNAAVRTGHRVRHRTRQNLPYQQQSLVYIKVMN
jgi:hypothetical protein